MSASSDTPHASPPGRPRDKNLDEALIRVTLELLSQTGVDSVTMARVGRLTGIPATSIYRRYPDARSLILAAIKEDLEKTELVLPDQGSLRADLLGFLRMIAAALNPFRARMLAGLLLSVQQDPELAALFTAKLEALRNDGWRCVISRAIQRGTLRAQALQAHPLDEVAATMIFHQSVVRFEVPDERFLTALLETVLLPSLEAFRRPDAPS
jgi:AcrR family transcriptional regulator